jgi:excinuclease ABC subunit C
VTDELATRAATLPTQAGVYLFVDRRGKVLYVGKAVNLRARVKQYLQGHDERQMVPFLVSRAVDVQVVVVDTEKEALLLENTLIKKHRPPFNAKLRDDSNFLHLRVDRTKAWPTFDLVRRIKADGARYFGPYHSASKARATLAFVHRAFPARTCTDAVLQSRKRPCLLHQMGRCLAPCVGLVDAAAYDEVVDDAIAFLEGKGGLAVRSLERRMRDHAERLEFEQAARLRDLVTSIRQSVERQKMVDADLQDRDVWGLWREGRQGAFVVMPVREGMMGEPRAGSFEAGEPDDELLSSLLNTVYDGALVPRQVLLPAAPANQAALAEVLAERRGGKVELLVPKIGDKARLVELAGENAKVRYHAKTDAEARHRNAMEALAEALELPAPPHRMECYDNSNLQGDAPVAARSVFLDGRPARAEYRRYRIKTVVGADDYASMRELVTRRFRRVLDGTEPAPDLLVVDGGKGQVAVAVAALQDLGFHDQPVVGIAKPRTEHGRGDRDATDKLVLPHRKDPLRLPRNHPGLRLVQHLRDEVHNHALKYHRKVRSEERLTSVLDELPGIGPARRTALLRALGSVEAVADADVDTLAAVPGIGPAVAAAIRAAFDGG